MVSGRQAQSFWRIAALVAVAGAAPIAGCRTVVTRSPVTFVDSTYRAFDGEEYTFGGWALARSCEEYTGLADFGTGGPVRVGDSDRPRTIQSALDAALSQKSGAVFLANVSIENELIERPWHPVQLCTVVSGAAMVRKNAASRKKAAPADSKPASATTTPRSGVEDDDEGDGEEEDDGK